MRRRAFPGYGPEVDKKYERAGKWLSAAIYRDEIAATWCKAHGVPIQKAAGETINAAGGFLVPAELAQAILDLRETYGAFRQSARLVPMASDSISVPRRPGGTGAYFMAENSPSTETNAVVDAINLTAKKIGSLIRLSSEVEEDGIHDMVDFVANEIAWAFAVKEDDCAFNGDGTSTYGTMRGLVQVLDGAHAQAKVVAQHNTFGTIDATDLTNLMAAVRASAVPNAAWFCSQTAYASTLCRIAATVGGGSVMQTRTIDGVDTPYYLGFPVFLSQKLPLVTTSLSGKVMMAFGDMYMGGALGQRRGITLARSTDRYMDQDQIAVLGTQRFHAVVHDLGDNTNVGAVAALVGS